jgi:hypothetical protein
MDIWITVVTGTGAEEVMRVNGKLFRVGEIYCAGDLIEEYGPLLDHLFRHPALHPDNRNWKVDVPPDYIIGAVQRRLRLRLGNIINNKLMLAEMPLWQISGSVSFALDPIKNRFHERFQLRKFKSGNEINVLKKIMDIWLVEIIRDLDFSPRRFGQCPKCDGLFYSPTTKERIYCSTKCGGAARQDKFREERRAEDH